MASSKHFTLVAVIAVVLAVLLTFLCAAGVMQGFITVSHAIGYEDRLFDTSKVHTFDIVIDDWDTFLTTCTSEEYSLCTVIIDGEKVSDVAIRGKGNTSLSNVASMDSSRYSFKIEFDHYESGKSYYGLDKLCLNNIIQDNTYMKDYVAYQLMDQFGVDAPLCSYVYITVNGEDWGLYLAVEGIEDSFLQRNYGSSSGELYKPDSMSFGGGRGNGKDFNMDDFDFTSLSSGTDAAVEMQDFGDFSFPEMPQSGDMPGQNQAMMPQDAGKQFSTSDVAEDMTDTASDGMSAMPDDFANSFFSSGTDFPSFPDMNNLSSGTSLNKGGMGGGMGSEDVKLQYIDDDPDSYSNIFDNAKTDVTDADKSRLISSLKDLSDYENLENVLDTDKVLRYFVVHNFLVNGDSYTGSMIHNYYLYEEDGKLSMIPWDYNLAFGTFQGNNASDAVNDPIDDALSDRPMQAWIFSDATYTEKYHQLYQEFLDTFDIASLITETQELIAPYVEKDPTAFCTYDEFLVAAETLKTFCDLRIQSISGQLSGVIPSTSEGQSADSTALISADSIDLQDLGTMSGAMGNHDKKDTGDKPDSSNDAMSNGDHNDRPFDEGSHGEASSDRVSGDFTPPSFPQSFNEDSMSKKQS